MTICFLAPGSEGFIDRCGYLLGDTELVDHAGDDQAAAMHVERGGVAVLVQVHGGGGSRRLLYFQCLLGAASVRGHLVAAAEFVLQRGGGLLQRYGSFDCHGRHSGSPSLEDCMPLTWLPRMGETWAAPPAD